MVNQWNQSLLRKIANQASDVMRPTFL